MTLAGAGLANQQRVVGIGNELQGVQLEAGLARQLRVECPIEVSQGAALVQARLLVAPLEEPGAPAIQLVLQDHGEGLEEGLLAGLGLQHAGLQCGADAGQAQLAQGAVDFSKAHGHG
ncbi:hypothetical protein D9M68_733310 [compost metagenome]